MRGIGGIVCGCGGAVWEMSGVIVFLTATRSRMGLVERQQKAIRLGFLFNWDDRRTEGLSRTDVRNEKAEEIFRRESGNK